jgi:hypothetical protein
MRFMVTMARIVHLAVLGLLVIRRLPDALLPIAATAVAADNHASGEPSTFTSQDVMHPHGMTFDEAADAANVVTASVEIGLAGEDQQTSCGL